MQCALKSDHHRGWKHHLILKHGIDIVLRRRRLKELCEWFVVEEFVQRIR
jgi:hypothetical protein